MAPGVLFFGQKPPTIGRYCLPPSKAADHFFCVVTNMVFCAFVKRILRREPVLCLSAAAALLSMLAVPPSPAYLAYIDLRVLCLLFSLMAVVLGLQECGVFAVLAQRLLSGRRQVRLLILILVLLPFFCSMLITNDVALITFVPFAILALTLIGRQELLIRVVVLQTIAANLGSMATPVGNPQNLFLYADYQLTAGSFFSVMLPLTAASLAGLTAASLWARRETIHVTFGERARLAGPRRVALFLVLFLLCLLSVFRRLPYWIPAAAVLLCLLWFAPGLLPRVDYSLLLTFVCFFIFAGNMGALPPVRTFLAGLLSQSALLPSALASQVISNVPAAVLLAGFTDDWRGLLMGVNIGGLGTPIASLASLISLKFYLRSPGARPLRYLAAFTLANLAGLAVLLPLAAFLL